jgi:hypothetical protein
MTLKREREVRESRRKGLFRGAELTWTRVSVWRSVDRTGVRLVQREARE